MLNKNNLRELAYVVKIDSIEPIIGSDNCEAAIVGGWKVMVRKGQFKEGDLAVYFEIDSRLPNKEPFMFLEKYHFHVKTQRYTFGGKNPGFYSQGLLMHFDDFGWDASVHKLGDFLTEELNVTYYEVEDNIRKANDNDKYKSMGARHSKLFKKPLFKWLMRKTWGRKFLFIFFGKKKDNKKGWPVGRFPGVSKTDQERCENMPWVLNDKTPFIVTQKCDGSSATYILERGKRNKFEFYVCSRNVRMLKPDQECFYGKDNYYWEVALKYDIENKLKDYLNRNKDISFVCWQGEICAPGIQGNPHNLKDTHFYAFHMTDSKTGRFDIREAAKIWKAYNMEVVPIVDENYILPDDFEEFKLSADGKYNSEVCEGNSDCDREGFVYYKSTEPTFSFKNVSRKYLAKK